MDARVVGKQEVIDTVAAVRSLCARLDPVLIPLHEVPEVYDELVALGKLADGAVLRMTARYEESNAWRRNGARCPEDDIAAKTGSTKNAARRRAETSKRLPQQPKTDAAVQGGELSEQQASAVSSGAQACPDDEDELLETARHKPVHVLEKRSAESKAKGEDSEARARRLFKARCLRRFRDIDGMEALLLKLPPERMAEIDAFLSGLIDREYADARDRGILEDWEVYAADVVYRLLTGQDAPPRPAATPTDDTPTADTAGEDAVAAGDDDATAEDAPGDDTPGTEVELTGRPVQARNANAVRPDRKVLAIIDVRALNRGHVEGDETCEIAGVGPVSVTAIRSLLSDAALALVIKDGVDIRNVTHLRRPVTAQQRTALEARGWWCERCGSTRRVEIDHNTGWTLTHDTVLDDLRLACGHCHDLKTHHHLRWAGPYGHGYLVDEHGNPWEADRDPTGSGGSDPPPAGAPPPRANDAPARDGPDDPPLFTLAD